MAANVNFDAVEALTFEQGSAEAPDSRWGLQTIRLSRLGKLHYQNRRRDVRLLEVEGDVARAKVEGLIDALRKTGFPEPPQASFEPGAGVCRLGVEASTPAFVLVDFYVGLELPGYAEVLQALADLNASLRTSDNEKLSAWEFVPIGEPKRSLMPSR
jgi:hypothetical protein